MIDWELFLAIKFEELVLDDWGSSEAAQAANVLDWGQFLKDCAYLKAQGVDGYPTSALVAARAQFNLLTHFVTSEIVDTMPAERHWSDPHPLTHSSASLGCVQTNFTFPLCPGRLMFPRFFWVRS